MRWRLGLPSPPELPVSRYEGTSTHLRGAGSPYSRSAGPSVGGSPRLL